MRTECRCLVPRWALGLCRSDAAGNILDWRICAGG